MSIENCVPPAAAPILADRLGRRIEYLRVSVTDRCDLRCAYCMPKGTRPSAVRRDLLAPAEFGRLVSLFAAAGVSRVRLTGGEPLTRGDLLAIVEAVRRVSGIDDISLSTNATQLAGQASALREAGVGRLNVSLDTLRADRFARITGHDRLAEVLRGLAAAAAAGFAPIKINMVVQHGINDDEVDDMVAFCREHGFLPRFIERMPVGAAGVVDGGSLQALRRRLGDRHRMVDALVPGGGPARYLKDLASGLTVGFITPMSQHFCATCNRLRLAADGALFTCLDAAGSVPLGARMRAGDGDEVLAAMIADAVWHRPAEHDFRHGRDRRPRPMAVTGG